MKKQNEDWNKLFNHKFFDNNISKYQLGIDITSKAIKNKMIEIHTTFKFQDKEYTANFIKEGHFGLSKMEETAKRFGFRRKTLKKSLSKLEIDINKLADFCEIDLSLRAQNLSVDDYINLTIGYEKFLK